MAATNYKELAAHAGHEVKIVIYGGDVNAAVECEDCFEVLMDYDNEEVA